MDITPELKYWQTFPPPSEAFISIFEAAHPATNLIKVVFTKDRKWHFEAKSEPANYYLQSITPFLAEVFEQGDLSAGQFLVVVSDWVNDDLFCEAPGFGFSKRKIDEKTLLLPDPFYLSTRGYEASLPLIESGRVPWTQRSSSCFWRGSSTGRSLSAGDWKTNPRVALCLMARAINDDTFLDAKLTDVVQCASPEVEQLVKAAGITGERLPVSTFLNYRYIVDIDGNSTAWGLFEKLYMGCVVLKVEGQWTQWFYPKLIPWTHYIPVRGDLSNLVEQIEWARSHDQECQEMTTKCQQLVQELNYPSVLQHYSAVISSVLSMSG